MVGRGGLLGLGFEKLPKLRRLTFCFAFPGRYAPFSEHTLLLELLSTITSSIFREFVLEPHDRDFDSTASRSTHWRYWGTVDEFLEERFSKGGDFKVIIRARDLGYDWETLGTLAAEGFPLLMRRGCIRFDNG